MVCCLCRCDSCAYVLLVVATRLISRADYLNAIENYINNLPEDLKPDDDLSCSDGGSLSESSDVSLGLHDEIDSVSADDDLDDVDSDSDQDSKAIDNIPEGFVHTPISHGDATNYPIIGDSCTIHYEGRIHCNTMVEEAGVTEKDDDALVFESTYARNKVVTIQLGRGDIIQGIEYALQYMSTGQTSRLIVPPEWAYGQVGYPPLVGSNETVEFKVELLRFSNDADARADTGNEPNPLPIGMEQFTKGQFNMEDVNMKAVSSYWQVVNDTV